MEDDDVNSGAFVAEGVNVARTIKDERNDEGERMREDIEAQVRKFVAELETLEKQPHMSDEEVNAAVSEIFGRIFNDVLEEAFEREGIALPDARDGKTDKPSEETKKKIAEKMTVLVHEKTNEFLNVIVGRIYAECGEPGTFGVVNDAISLLSKEPYKAQPRTQKSDDAPPDEKLIGVAAYNILSGKIKISDVYMEGLQPIRVIFSLARRGSSDPLVTLHHEFIHSLQHHAPEKVKNSLVTMCWWDAVSLAAIAAAGVLVGVGAGLSLSVLKAVELEKRIGMARARYLLNEAQAYFGSARYARDSEAPDSDTLKNRVKDSFPLPKFSGADAELETVVAIHSVKRLYALGFSDREIGELIKKAKWSKIRLAFSLLEDTIHKRMEEKGLMDSDVDNLVVLDDLRRKVYVRKSRIIVQEEIKKAADKISTA
ncbi:MAG: hypothetical protein A2939_00615 [Parcubacteria group bacterium RIFCSPLOWO2_01_FULL_48_18]|nr:MAG: hypothetical protein A2939_00615 [Parcubacteria group bacterium RIFCSPLOWO2_01_FULL_48_18]